MNKGRREKESGRDDTGAPATALEDAAVPEEARETSET